MSKILVVDDDHDSRFFLRAFLGEDGHEVETAENFAEADELLSQFQPDVLVVDWLLSGGRTGLEVANEAFRRNSQVGIIFISGLPPEVIHRSAAGVPCLAVLNKPLDFESIARIISDVVRRRDAGELAKAGNDGA